MKESLTPNTPSVVQCLINPNTSIVLQILEQDSVAFIFSVYCNMCLSKSPWLSRHVRHVVSTAIVIAINRWIGLCVVVQYRQQFIRAFRIQNVRHSTKWNNQFRGQLLLLLVLFCCLSAIVFFIMDLDALQ